MRSAGIAPATGETVFVSIRKLVIVPAIVIRTSRRSVLAAQQSRKGNNEATGGNGKHDPHVQTSYGIPHTKL